MATDEIGMFWDQMYAGDGYRYGRRPNAWLAQNMSRLPQAGTVLSVGDGEGRNGVWMAESGFRVTTIDASAVGVAKARDLAEARGVLVDARVGLFPQDMAGDATYDAIVLCYVHAEPAARRRLHSAVQSRLAPGGWVLLEAFTPAQLGRPSGGPQRIDLLYTAADLRVDFASLELVHLAEEEVVLAEGAGHEGAASVVRLLAHRR